MKQDSNQHLPTGIISVGKKLNTDCCFCKVFQSFHPHLQDAACVAWCGADPPLFFCSMLSCLSKVSLSSLSRTSSIFSSVLSSWSCFSCARAFSMATLSRPCLETHRHTSTGYTLNESQGRHVSERSLTSPNHLILNCFFLFNKVCF